MEEWEKELLIEEYPNSEETIREGKLYENHIALLNEIRTGMSYLEEKYPGYKFSISYRDDWAVTIIDYRVTEETTGESFKLRFHTDEERKHQPEDDFYIYFIEDAYQEYLEEQLMQRSDKVTEVTVSITRTRGEGYDDKITVDDVVSGKFELDPSINIYVLADEGTEAWCEQYTGTEMQKIIEELDQSGIYVIHFYIFPKGAEHVEENEEYIDYIVMRWEREGELDSLKKIKEEANPNADFTVGYVVEQLKTVELEDDKDYGSYMTGADWKNILQAVENDETLCNIKIEEVHGDPGGASHQEGEEKEG